MRIALLLLACGGLAACGGGAVTVPSESVIMEVPQTGSASTTGGDDFTSTIEASLAEGGTAVAPSADGTGTRAR